MTNDLNQHFTYEKNPDGTFLYKAKPFVVKKPKEQDPYHFPIVKRVEDEFKKKGEEMNKQIGTDIIDFLKTI